MDKLTDPNFWHDNWEVVRKAPWIVIPLVVVAGIVVWVFRSSLAKSTIDGLVAQNNALRDQNEAQEKRRLLAEESARAVTREREAAEAKVEKLTAQIREGAPLPALAQTTSTITESFKVIGLANNAVERALTKPNSDFAETPIALREGSRLKK